MPTIAEVLTLAVKSHQAGQRKQAERLYREILRVDPQHPDALHLLGVIGNETGNQAMAVENIGRAIALRPGFAEFHNNLGNALQAQGKFDEAVASFHRALELKPEYATAHNNLGNALKSLGQFDAAIANYRRALAINPGYAAAHCNLGSALQAQGNYNEAVESFHAALLRNPNFVEAYNNLGNAFQAQGLSKEAEKALQTALKLRPNYPEALNNLGAVLQAQGQLDQAAEKFRAALKHRPDFTDAQANLGIVLMNQGRFDEAAECFERTLERNSKNAVALFELANLAREGHGPDEVYEQRARELLSEIGLTGDEAAMLHFIVGAAEEKRKDFDSSFTHYLRGSELRREFLKSRNMEIDHEKYLSLIDQMIATFTPEYFERVRGWGSSSERPVFIVGMPRSGTTLVEQILASHPRVFGAGELKHIGQIASRLPRSFGGTPYPRCAAEWNRDTVSQIAEDHLDQLRELHATADRIVDKMPLNYNHLGLIAALFPKSRVIHCQRYPLDTIASCLRKHAIPSSPEEIAVCYRQYEKLMAHWRRVLPISMYEIPYENLVADPGTMIPELIAFCGLAWDDRCLAFHETDRAVQTPSKLEVRQPMHSQAVGRWKRYEQQLQPAAEILGLDVSDSNA